MPTYDDRGIMSLAGAAGLGAAAMYFLDPARGTRRRRMVADKVAHTRHVVDDGIRTTRQDLRNRAIGMSAKARRRLTVDDASDEVVAERVRADLGRVVSHPGAIDVSVQEGRAILSGDVLTDEAEKLLRHTRTVRGVQEIVDWLERHDTADDVPSLQGPGRPSEPRFELLQQNWSPTARLLTGVTGGALALGGLKRGGLVGWPVGLAGAALFARAMANEPLRRLTGLGADRDAARAPGTNEARPEEVFDY